MPTQFLTLAERQALNQFPPAVTQSDLVRFFKLSESDLAQVLALRGEANRLGFALQLGTLRFLGFCPGQEAAVPLSVLQYLAQQLAIDPAVIDRYGRRAQTRRRHRLAVEQYLGFQGCSPGVLAHLQAWLIQRALEHDKPSLLLELAMQKLHQDKIVRPGLSTLERLVGQVRTQAMQVTFELIQPLLAPQHYRFLDQLLEVDESLAMTRLSWLRRPATINSPRAILKTLEKLQWLDQHQVGRWNLAQLNPNRVKFLAQLGQRSSAQALQRHAAPKRYAILVAFVCQIRTEVTDEVIDLFVRCLGDTYARARRYRQAAHLEAEVALNEKVRLLHQVAAVVLDLAVADEQVRSVIFERVPQAVLQAAIADCVRLMRPYPDHALDFFVARYSYLRQFIPAFLETLQFRSTLEPNPLLEALFLLHQLNQQQKRQVPTDAPTICIPAAWLPFLLDETQQIRRRYYELGVLWQLRSALQAGTVWLDGSRRYGLPTSDLLPPQLWPSLRSEFAQLIPMPLQAPSRLAHLQQEFQTQLQRLNAGMNGANNNGVRLEDHQLVVAPLPAVELPPSAVQLQRKLGLLLPLVDLTDLLVEVDLATHFSDCLTHAGGDLQRQWCQIKTKEKKSRGSD